MSYCPDSEAREPVALSEEVLEQVSGGVSSRITAHNANSHVRQGPGLRYPPVGVLKNSESLRYLNDTAIDERGCLWYRVAWKGGEAWVSSRYTRQEKRG